MHALPHRGPHERPTLDELRKEILRLSTEQRAELAHALSQSLDGSPDQDVEDASDAEISRRVAAIDAGTAKTFGRSELRRRMQQRMRDG